MKAGLARGGQKRYPPKGVPVFAVGWIKGELHLWMVWRCVSKMDEPIARGRCSSYEEGIARALAVAPSAQRIRNCEVSHQGSRDHAFARRLAAAIGQERDDEGLVLEEAQHFLWVTEAG